MKSAKEKIHGQFTAARNIIAQEYDGKLHTMERRPLSKIDIAEASALGTIAALETYKTRERR